uniref:Preprofallaxidin-5 n=1 Tax=Litoria fallax TaxID=115422 RepID=FALX5_LITFA|nr:RecName: Full=Preprofallaxidin-5; Contains: RecName: Full=Fallaxidin-5.1; Flags: Precursor [Litoria fallax]ACH53449.1 preprofallaxidin 5.1 [Litoria fallax]
MASLKKSLFLVLFLGFVSLSICEEEKREDKEDEGENEEAEENHEERSEEKRFLPLLASLVGGLLGKRS